MENSRNILSWAEQDRPREKLLQKGNTALTDSELVAILLGSGTRQLSAVDLAKHILRHFDNSLNRLGQATYNELVAIKGIGPAKALTLLAALELGRRKKESATEEIIKISNSRILADYVRPYFQDLRHEEVFAVYLNASSGVIALKKISSGGTTSSIIDVKIVVKHAIELLAESIILVHNHPSGQLQPSKHDIKITLEVYEAAKLLNIKLVDHVIITNASYYSLRDNQDF